jgi:hypothetical protein
MRTRAQRLFVTLVFAPLLGATSLALSMCSYRNTEDSQAPRSNAQSATPVLARARPVRVEELTPEAPDHELHVISVVLRKPNQSRNSAAAAGHPLRVEDLAPAGPVAVRPLRVEELNPELLRNADEVLWKYDAPIGSEVGVVVEGKTYVARFEQHYHEEGGPLRPWGYHKGVTLYASE